jgi:hypothetical protein
LETCYTFSGFAIPCFITWLQYLFVGDYSFQFRASVANGQTHSLCHLTLKHIAVSLPYLAAKLMLLNAMKVSFCCILGTPSHEKPTFCQYIFHSEIED